MTGSAVTIGLVEPELLGTYGDGGNARVLAARLRWRGIESRVLPIRGADTTACDIYVVGGGEDAAQSLAAQRLRPNTAFLGAADRNVPVLAVCAGMQLLGKTFAGSDGERLPGLEMLDLITERGTVRAVGEMVVDSKVGGQLTGFENHAGVTLLGPSAVPLGTVRRGMGNGPDLRIDGAIQGRIVGTYLHGPVLARNPALADTLLEWVVGHELAPLPLDVVDTLRAERFRQPLQEQRRGRASAGLSAAKGALRKLRRAG